MFDFIAVVTLPVIVLVMFVVSIIRANVEASEKAAFYKINAIRKEEAKLKASMLKVVECLKLIKEFEAKGYKSTTAYYRNELAQQRAWMNHHRANLAALKGA